MRCPDGQQVSVYRCIRTDGAVRYALLLIISLLGWPAVRVFSMEPAAVRVFSMEPAAVRVFSMEPATIREPSVWIVSREVSVFLKVCG